MYTYIYLIQVQHASIIHNYTTWWFFFTVWIHLCNHHTHQEKKILSAAQNIPSYLFLSTCVDYSWPLHSLSSFRNSINFQKKTCRDIDWNRLESIYQLMENWHLENLHASHLLIVIGLLSVTEFHSFLGMNVRYLSLDLFLSIWYFS